MEDAILEAAWAELSESGYAGLTMENVARRAGTSRPVLHRRWPSRTALATAALAQRFAHATPVIPDMGNVRDELCLLLRHMSDRANSGDLQLFFDMQKDLVLERSSFMDLRNRLVEGNQYCAVLARAIVRLAMSYVSMPPETDPELGVDVAADLARLMTPFAERYGGVDTS